MKQRFVFSFVFSLLVCVQAHAQNSWTKKNWNTNASGRTYPAAFEIGGIVYFGTGYNTSSNQILSDFWAFNPVANTMTQVASFPGSPRFGCVSFSTGGKGYLGLGKSFGNVFYTDFYRYDPGTNAWTQIATFPGTAVWGAVSFILGGKAYVGTGGFGAGSSTQGSLQATNEFYSYDPTTNTWSAQGAVANYPQPIQAGVAFSIAGLGYVGTGANGNASALNSNFYKYNPSTNQWTQIADLPTPGRSSAYACALAGLGYVGLGGTAVNLADLWQFNPGTGTWLQVAPFTGSARHAGIAVPANDKGYFIGGQDQAEIWEYAPATTGIPASAERAAFEVLPNPATDDVLVRFKAFEKGRLIVFNVVGQPVLQANFEGSEVRLRLSALPAGQYSLRAVLESGLVQTEILTRLE